MSKQWKQLKIYDSFEEADNLRKKMKEADETGKLEIRVRRCGVEGTKFKVKTYYPPTPTTTKKQAKRK